MKLSQRMKEMMGRSARVHLDTDLEERIKFILQDFQCVCKDQNDAKSGMEDIANFVEKSKEETWEEVVNRFDDSGDWVRDMVDVHNMFSMIASGGEEIMEGYVFFIDRPREGGDNNAPHFMDQ